MKKLTIYLNKRLPDTHTIPDEFDNYGRFGVTNSGHWFFRLASSSHLSTTKEGFYWAINYREDKLFISPRGSDMNWKHLIDETTILWILEKLKLKYKEIKIIGYKA